MSIDHIDLLTGNFSDEDGASLYRSFYGRSILRCWTTFVNPYVIEYANNIESDLKSLPDTSYRVSKWLVLSKLTSKDEDAEEDIIVPWCIEIINKNSETSAGLTVLSLKYKLLKVVQVF